MGHAAAANDRDHGAQGRARTIDEHADRGAALSADTQPGGFDRLTPLATARAALLAAATPVALVSWPLARALGRVVADPVRAPSALPPDRVAMRDGWAVASRTTIGASPYAPVYVAARPPAARAGTAIPGACDAMLPPHGLSADAAGIAILQAVAPGTDTREPGGDCAAGAILVEAGEHLDATHVAVLALAGVEGIALRVPRVCVNGPAVSPVRDLLETLARRAGADLGDDDDTDLVIALCEPGHAGTVPAVALLAGAGRLIAHGLALRPGEAVGLGEMPRRDGGRRLVVVVPERLDDAMAAWLLLIQPCLAALAGSVARPRVETRPVARKIVSAPGLADLVLLKQAGTARAPVWEPIATGDLPWSALARADAYCLVAPESEGIAAGEPVAGCLL